MNSKEVLGDLFVGLGVAGLTKEHVLMVVDYDGYILEWNTAPGTKAGYESLVRQAGKMNNNAWVEKRDIKI